MSTMEGCKEIVRGILSRDDSLSPAGAQGHQAALRSLFFNTGTANTQDLTSRYGVVEEIRQIKTLKGETLAFNSQKNMLNVLAKMIDLKMILAASGLKDQMLKASEVYKQMRQEQVSGQKDSEPVLFWGTLMVEVEKRFAKLDKEAVFMQLYNAVPARDNLNAVYLTSEDQVKPPRAGEESRNYIILPTKRGLEGTFVLQRYKSINKFDIQKRPLSVKLTKLLVEFVKDKRVKEGAYLFGLRGSSEKLGMMVSSMSKKLGLPVGSQGVNMLRHSYASSHNTNTAEERAELSLKMLHSSSTNRDYTRRTVRSIAELK
ncbi:hypothetical protein B484DRAFT_461967 [Ochromonadaceae sp. CCMP2298]|nr:hypothetical protein B484DRAFT_461967 [Ochromonadaceae sp. CCMP2298]